MSDKAAALEREFREMMGAVLPAPEITASIPKAASSYRPQDAAGVALNLRYPTTWDTEKYPVLKVGEWLKTIPFERMAQHLVNVMHANREQITVMQQLLIDEIPRTYEEKKEQFRRLDSLQYLANSLLGEANMLLDKAEQVTLVPCGTSAICRDEDTGMPIPATGCKVEYGDDDFRPKYKELTDNDRSTRQDATCAPFRRFRDEMQAIAKGIENRIFNLKGIDRMEANA